MWKLANIEETTGNSALLSFLNCFYVKSKFQQKNKLGGAELHKILDLSTSGNCCLPLFIAIHILPYSRKNLQNTAAYGGGVVSLISRLHANRILLHRENVWHPYGCKKTFQIETEQKPIQQGISWSTGTLRW